MAGRGAAVAQILGMSTDQHLVASMNPGLSGRAIDSGVFQRPTSSPAISLPPVNRTQTPVPGTLPSPALTPRPAPRPEVPAVAMMELPDSLAMAVPARSGWATAAWTILGMGVAVGVGVILFVAAGERRGSVAATAPNPPPTAAVVVDAGVPVDAAKPPPGPGPGPGSANNPTRTVDNPDTPRPIKDPVPRGKPGGGTAAPVETMTEAAAAKRLAEGDDLKDRLKYSEAKAAYDEVIASGHYRGDALVGLASVYSRPPTSIARSPPPTRPCARARATPPARCSATSTSRRATNQALVY